MRVTVIVSLPFSSIHTRQSAVSGMKFREVLQGPSMTERARYH